MRRWRSWRSASLDNDPRLRADLGTAKRRRKAVRGGGLEFRQARPEDIDLGPRRREGLLFGLPLDAGGLDLLAERIGRERRPRLAKRRPDAQGLFRLHKATKDRLGLLPKLLVHDARRRGLGPGHIEISPRGLGPVAGHVAFGQGRLALGANGLDLGPQTLDLLGMPL